MTTTDAFRLEPDFDRDGYGRPMIIPREGGQPVAYTRCTTFVSALEDTAKLADWKQRMVAIGLSRRNDLLLQAASLDVDDRKGLDRVCGAALDAAAASAAATTGTALHKMTENLDRGESIAHLPPNARADLDAYAAATKSLTALRIETHLVLDEFKIAGTADRVVEFEGRRYIADVKTGRIDYGQLKIAMQLAVYAHSDLYDVKSGNRMPLDVDHQRAIVIHLPAGKGTCELVWADIATAWEALPLAKQVREWRSKGRRLMTPLAASQDDPLPIDTRQPDPALVKLRDEIASAQSVEQLGALWREHRARWDDELTQLAAARKALLA